MSEIWTRLSRARVIVCVGTGGVGKTTTAAAIAVEAARQGKRSLVLTIDPALRLADALGIGELGNEPRDLTDEIRDALLRPNEGQLFAMMLDMKGTFDGMVERFADSPEARDRVFANPIYQHVSDALAGSAEYAAMEKVFELAEGDRFDVIVLDTPPSQHALDFLEAPRRLVEFLDSRWVRMLVHPAFSAGRLGFRLFQGATQPIFRLIERVTGIGFLQDISEFLIAFEGMSEGFSQRAHRVQSLLLGAESAFILVAGPTPESAHNATLFLDRLQDAGVPLAGVIVNRVRRWPGGGDPPPVVLEAPDSTALEEGRGRLTAALAAQGAAHSAAQNDIAARAAIAAARDYACLVDLDHQSTRPLAEQSAAMHLFLEFVPELREDVHDLSGVALIARALFHDEGSSTLRSETGVDREAPAVSSAQRETQRPS